MNLIYLHGFRSNANSIKGTDLKNYCQQYHADITVHTPDLNMPPQAVMVYLSTLIEQHTDVVLVGSSLGGFYATQLVVKYAIPAVLINPAVQPWQLFYQLFDEQLPLQVHPNWCLDAQQLEDMHEMAAAALSSADKVLVLLKQGDEVLDYRAAQRYYSQVAHCALLITEQGGDHAMHDFKEKIPMLLQFLSDGLN